MLPNLVLAVSWVEGGHQAGRVQVQVGGVDTGLSVVGGG